MIVYYKFLKDGISILLFLSNKNQKKKPRGQAPRLLNLIKA